MASGFAVQPCVEGRRLVVVEQIHAVEVRRRAVEAFVGTLNGYEVKPVEQKLSPADRPGPHRCGTPATWPGYWLRSTEAAHMEADNTIILLITRLGLRLPAGVPATPARSACSPTRTIRGRPTNSATAIT
jgi:hypothetical protein